MAIELHALLFAIIFTGLWWQKPTQSFNSQGIFRKLEKGDNKQFHTTAEHLVKSFVECGYLCLRETDCQYFQHHSEKWKPNCKLCTEISTSMRFHGTNDLWNTYELLDFKPETFDYYSPLWSNKESYNEAGGRTGFDYEETKLPTYWSTSFKKICLGMTVGNKTNFLTIDFSKNSLYECLADEVFRGVTVSWRKWQRLLANSTIPLDSVATETGISPVYIT